MRLLPLVSAVLGLCLAVASSGAFADNNDGPDLDAIRTQQTELRADAAAGKGIFEEMSQAERAQLVSRQEVLLSLIDGKQALDEMGEEEKVEAFNLLQEINAVVNNAEASQVVCEYIKKTGSHRKVKQCMTVAQRRQLREQTQDVMQKEAMRGYDTRGTAGP